MNERKVPRIRFKGFEDDWEQRKLSDYLVTSTIKNYDGKYNREDVFSVSGDVGIVNQIEFQGRSFAGASVLNYGVVQNGDIVYTKSPLKSNPYGIIKVNGGESGIVSTLYAVYHTKENTDPKFVECYFDSDWRLNNYLHPLVNKGAKNDMKVTADNALKGLVTFPASRKEQEKISGLISKLEEAITLHQRELDKLKTVKKSTLENCFPKNGEKVPKFRFSGFTDDWEQRKLGDIADSFEYGLNTAAKEFDGTNKYIRITDIDDSTHEFLKTDLTSPDVVLEQAGNYKLHEGDILFARTGASVGKTYIYRQSDGLVYYAGFLIRVRIGSTYDPEFVFQNTLTPNYDRYIRITSQRSGQPGVNAQEYAEYDLMVPSLDEQLKIGAFMRKLDKLITLHQRKLDKLHKIKKSMLQYMFV